MRRTLLNLAVFIGVFTFAGDGAIAAVPKPPIASIAQSAAASNAVPGFSIAVVQHGQIIYESGFGLANIEKHILVTANTPFAIGSLTKQFTAVAVLMLAQQGRLKLSDSLGQYLPQLPNAKSITLNDLLHQTSGLSADFPDANRHPLHIFGETSPDELLSFMAQDAPDFAPGTKWEYANANYVALAAIIAKVSGVSYQDFLQTNIFGPLKMRSSAYGVAAQEHLSLPVPYEGAAPFKPYPYGVSLDLYYGAGGIISTAHDVALWDSALMDKRLLNAASTALLWTPGTISNGERTSYAMAFMVTSLDGHREVWHNGFITGAGGYCYNAIFPDDDIAVVVLTNGDMEAPKVSALPVDLVRSIFENLVSVNAASNEDPEL